VGIDRGIGTIDGLEQVDGWVVGWEISNRRVEVGRREGQEVDRGNRWVGTDSNNGVVMKGSGSSEVEIVSGAKQVNRWR